jgi:PhzF family phenazine biosynthesis protein
MIIPLYQANAFTDHFSGGNPAGVCPLNSWLSDEQMQSIARENNFSETAFFVKSGDAYDLRWFTPGCEVDLCGHATLATTKVLAEELGDVRESYCFNTRSGQIVVKRKGDTYQLNMPATTLTPTPCPIQLRDAIGYQPTESFLADDYLLVFEQLSEKQLIALEPNFSAIKMIPCRGVIVTCQSDNKNIDFVSRWFGSADVGIDEDPVTGSAHCQLVPYWSAKLGKSILKAQQVSTRKGALDCDLKHERVLVAGKAVIYFKGEIRV